MIVLLQYKLSRTRVPQTILLRVGLGILLCWKVSLRFSQNALNLWTTQNRDGDLHAAGDTPNLHEGGHDLPSWSEEDKSLDEQDLVIWHTVGVTHLPRPEDWPVMPVEYCGFMLQPVGFFVANPAVDVAPTDHCQ